MHVNIDAGPTRYGGLRGGSRPEPEQAFEFPNELRSQTGYWPT